MFEQDNNREDFYIDTLEYDTGSPSHDSKLQIEGYSTNDTCSSVAADINSNGIWKSISETNENINILLSNKKDRNDENIFSVDSGMLPLNIIENVTMAHSKKFNKKASIDADKLKSKCENGKEVLKRNTGKYEEAIAVVRNELNESSLSEKEIFFLSDYMLVLKLCLLANKYDIGDFETLSECAYKSFDGELIRNSSNHYFKDMISHFITGISSIIVGVTYNLDRSNINNRVDDDANRKYYMFSLRMKAAKESYYKWREYINYIKEYNGIVKRTGRLFKDGNDIRKIADKMIFEMNSKLESNDYTSRVSDNPMIFAKRGNTSYSADIDELLTEIK